MTATPDFELHNTGRTRALYDNLTVDRLHHAAQVRVGVLPRLLEEILQTRIMVKKVYTRVIFYARTNVSVWSKAARPV